MQPITNRLSYICYGIYSFFIQLEKKNTTGTKYTHFYAWIENCFKYEPPLPHQERERCVTHIVEENFEHLVVIKTILKPV